MRNTAEENSRKSLLLAAASYFEKSVGDQLIQTVRSRSGECEIVLEFVRNKAIERQYHTFFSWRESNANLFFGLFGDGFKNFMKVYVKANPEYGDSIKAFLEVGGERNRLIHQDFGNFPLEKTSEEIYAAYKKARIFADTIGIRMIEYLETNESSGRPTS